jgi:internalin A
MLMMRIQRCLTCVFLLVACLGSTAALAEDPVYFADANLKAAVEQALGVTNPTPTDMLGLTLLGDNGRPIANLTGLQYGTNLVTLQINSGQVSDLSALSGLTNLQTLRLRINEISNLSPLSGLTNLQTLDLYHNQIGDLSPLCALTNLQTLNLGSNPAVTLVGLSSLTSLQILWFQGGQVSDLSPLAPLTELRELRLDLQRISDLSPLAGLTNLQKLTLAGNPISDVSPLAGLVSLSYLNLGGTQITDFSRFSGLPNLQTLWLENGQVSNVSVRPDLPSLQTLHLNHNRIGDISGLSAMTNLISLSLNDNQISDLSPLADLTNLRQLDAENNLVSDLSPLAGLPKLELLTLGVNQISDVSPLAGLTNLDLLLLACNSVSDISPLAGLTKLTTLILGVNQINDISPLAGLTNLWNLDLSNNQISKVSPIVSLPNLLLVRLASNPLDRDAYCHDLEALRLLGANIEFSSNSNPPGGVSATDGTDESKVTVGWDALCSGPYGGDPFQYIVYRSPSLDGAKTPISGWLDDTSFDDTTASPGVHYWYWVKSDNSGEVYSDPAEGWRGLPTGPSLVIFSTGHGWVTTPGEGAFSYAYGTSVPVVATPMEPYTFINWTGTAVDAGKVADPAAASTTVMVDGAYTLQANFTTIAPGVMRTLTTTSTAGGHVWEPGEGTFEYDDGTEVSVVAVPDDGYQFAGWTGTAVDAGKVADPESASITLTMDADYTLTANFEPAGGPLEYKLVMSAGTGGYVSEPGEGTFAYEVITTVPIVAHAYTGYRFSRWTGTAVNAGKVASTTSENTTVMVDGDYNLQANFVRSGQFSVKVLAPNGGETLLAGGTFAIHWQTQGEIANLSIDLTVDGGSTWTHVSSPSASTGSYDWPLPKIDSDRCLVRICVLDNAAISDVSDAFFSIRKPAGHIWYVDTTAAPGGDGTSWETALACLQDGLARAADGDSVWVAEGLYWPDLGGGQLAGNRAATFGLKSGAAIYGGFPAGGGTWEQRHPLLHQSILSGDIGKPNVATDNSYHVVNGSGTDKTAILDGFTITGGVADGIEAQDRGAGLYNLGGSPQVHNCILAGNAAAGDGGGAWNSQSAATFVNCVFNGNTAGNNGGGLYSEQGDVTITNCTFTANEALWRAGGVFNASGTAEVVNCILWGNSRMGGVSYDELAQVSGDPKPALSYCCVQGWTGSLGGQNNFGRDPLFLDAAGADDVVGTPDDDLRLQPGSPCIDKGDNAAVPPEAATDQQGDPRIISNAVDMGAYEFGAMPAPSETGGP